MPKAKSRKRIDEDEMPIVEPLPLDPVKKVPVETSMILDMEGKGAEVASALIVNGLSAFLAVTNKGVNLVATNRATTEFLPVKITSRANWPELDLKRDDAERLEKAGAVLAFLAGEDDDRTTWYLSVGEFLSKARDRGESTLSIKIDDHWEWLEKFEGHAGIKKAFAKLLK